MDALTRIFTNPEFVSGAANLSILLLTLYFAYRITSITRNACFFVAEMLVVVFLIYSVNVFNKEAKFAKIIDTSIVQPLDKIDVEGGSRNLVESLTTAVGWAVTTAMTLFKVK